MQISPTNHCRVTFYPPPSGLGWGIVCNKALWCGCEQIVIRQIKWVLHVHQLISGHKIYSDWYFFGCTSEACLGRPYPRLPTPLPSTPPSLCPPNSPWGTSSPFYLLLFNTNVAIRIFPHSLLTSKRKKKSLNLLKMMCIKFVSSIYCSSGHNSDNIYFLSHWGKENKIRLLWKNGRRKLGTSPQSKLSGEGAWFNVIVPS